MPVDRKILERIDKLLRLASSQSGAGEHERASAALEVVKLITQNDLVVRPRAAQPKIANARAARKPAPSSARTVPTPSRPQPRSQWGVWGASTAAYDSYCADPDCGDPITYGSDVWRRVKNFEVEYLHIDCPHGKEENEE